MKDTRTPTQHPAGVSRQNIEQALMNDQDALRAEAGKLAAEPAAASDATSWFELLYQAAARGKATIPWASLAPNPHLVQWARGRPLRGTGRTALVVGCGLGDDAEFAASLGFNVVAFDISPTAIDGARSRFPGSSVHYTPGRPAEPARLLAGRLRPRRGDLHRPATPRHRPYDCSVHAVTPRRP
jgi:2-polyprenyl-3-methyl-5-hydroxy-6-metoxy-1,4-benzoquinol methylase